MKKILLSVLFVCLASILIVCGKKDEMKYAGSSTIGQNILPDAIKLYESKTGIKFSSVDNPGSGKGIKALLEGKVRLAGASRALKENEKKQGIYAAVVGYDAIAVIVNKKNPVKNLTKEQLKGIFTGKIKNWKEVGGKNAPIKPNTEIQGEKRATMLVFQEIVMDNEAYGKGFLEIDLPKDQVPEVVKDPNGIASVSLAFTDNSIKLISVNGIKPSKANVQNGSYLISRPLILITKGFPTGNEKRFIEFMKSPDAQKIVAKKFVPVK